MGDLINVILVDDHPLMRLGVKASLMSYKDEINVAGEASSADELFSILPDKKVDVVLLDIQMPGMSCEDAVRKLKKDFPKLKILILSSINEDEIIYRLIKVGIDGFVPKTTNIEKIKTAIRNVYSGLSYYGVDITKIMGHGNQDASSSLIAELTEREKEVIVLCCDGLLSKEIASRLNISHRTVEMHKSNVFKKLGVNNTIELLKWSIEHGIVKLN
jgi:DNA-binding NarL/FixJ family response regulator